MPPPPATAADTARHYRSIACGIVELRRWAPVARLECSLGLGHSSNEEGLAGDPSLRSRQLRGEGLGYPSTPQRKMLPLPLNLLSHPVVDPRAPVTRSETHPTRSHGPAEIR